MRLGTASPGSRPLQPPTPTPSQALGKISKTGRSDAERFTVYLLPNAGIWEPTEREIRAKCGGGLDWNSGRSRSRTAGPLGSQEPDRCCGGKAMDQTPGWGEAGRGWQTRVPSHALPSARRPSLGSQSRKEQHHRCLVSGATSETGGFQGPT